MKTYVSNKLIIKQRELLPRFELSKFIESFWESSDEGQVLLAPEGTFHIIYSPKPFSIFYDKTSILKAGVYLFPINMKLISIDHKCKLVGIRIKAFSFNNITNDTKFFSEKNSNFWRLNQNLPIVKYCETKLKQNTELFYSLPFLEELFYELLSGTFNLKSSLRDKVNYILDRKGQIKIAEMAKNFNVSRQYLHKYFIKHLNISPKQLSNIWKINNFIYISNRQKSLTVSALDSGYYDQAHCIREFKIFFKYSPKFIKNNNMLFTSKCINNRFNNWYDPK